MGVEIVDRSHPAAAEGLVSDLSRLRREAGSPSLGQLVKLSQHKLSKSTLDDHLSGRRARLPPWRLVSAYVSACRAAAASTGLDVERLGTLEEWHARWVAALEGNSDAPSPIKDPSSIVTGTLALPVINDLAEFPDHSDMGDSRTLSGQTAASRAPVIQRLEDDLSKLARTVSEYNGLLVVTSGPTVGTKFSVEHNITTIGRDPESDIWLNEPTVSRRHAEIHRYGDRFMLRDVGSHNGTFLRQKRIASEAPLSSYQELRIAVFRLLFVQGGAAAAKAHKRHYPPVQSHLIQDVTRSTEEFRGFAERADDDDAAWALRTTRWGRRRRRN